MSAALLEIFCAAIYTRLVARGLCCLDGRSSLYGSPVTVSHGAVRFLFFDVWTYSRESRERWLFAPNHPHSTLRNLKLSARNRRRTYSRTHNITKHSRPIFYIYILYNSEIYDQNSEHLNSFILSGPTLIQHTFFSNFHFSVIYRGTWGSEFGKFSTQINGYSVRRRQRFSSCLWKSITSASLLHIQ